MEIDIQEQTRRDDVYVDINKIVDSVTVLPVFPSLVWVWCWDLIVDQYKNHQWGDVVDDGFEDYAIPQGLELKTIWNKLWEDADSLGLSLEYGAESVVETIDDWLKENDFLVSTENEGEDEDEDE